VPMIQLADCTGGKSTNPGPLAQAGSSSPIVGRESPDQPVTVGRSTNPGPLTQADAASPIVGLESPDQPVTVTPPMTARQSIDGGLNSPTSPNTINTTANTVVNQIYGQGNPTNVFV